MNSEVIDEACNVFCPQVLPLIYRDWWVVDYDYLNEKYCEFHKERYLNRKANVNLEHTYEQVDEQNPSFYDIAIKLCISLEKVAHKYDLSDEEKFIIQFIENKLKEWGELIDETDAYLKEILRDAKVQKENYERDWVDKKEKKFMGLF